MASLDFKGPTWKADKAIMEYLGSSFLRSFTITPDDISEHRVVCDYPRAALEGERYIGDEKMNIGAENMNINVQINSIKGRIETLSAAPRQKEALLKLVEPLFGKAFGRREALMILGRAVATGAKYVAILESAGAIEPVQGLGKGKYRFAVK